MESLMAKLNHVGQSLIHTLCAQLLSGTRISRMRVLFLSLSHPCVVLDMSCLIRQLGIMNDRILSWVRCTKVVTVVYTSIIHHNFLQNSTEMYRWLLPSVGRKQWLYVKLATQFLKYRTMPLIRSNTQSPQFQSQAVVLLLCWVLLVRLSAISSNNNLNLSVERYHESTKSLLIAWARRLLLKVGGGLLLVKRTTSSSVSSLQMKMHNGCIWSLDIFIHTHNIRIHVLIRIWLSVHYAKGCNMWYILY